MSTKTKGRRQKNFQGEGATEKRLKNSKDQKIALLSLFQGVTTEIRSNNSKKDRKIALASIYYIYTMNENPGGRARPSVPAVKAHA